MDAIDHAGQGEHGGESAAVVADAGTNEAGAGATDANRRAGWKDSVEMGADHDRCDVGIARAPANDIVRGVDTNIAESDRAVSIGDPCAAANLVAGGRLDFRYGNLRFDDCGIALAQRVACACNGCGGPEILDERLARHAFN